MTTPFALLIQLCGLSQREAADWLDVRPDTVKSWAAGRRTAPGGALAVLAELAARIDRAGREAAAEIERRSDAGEAPDTIELGLAADDAEARALGWPCVGAHRAVLARAAAAILAEHEVGVEVVPRGSTAATAAAADAHGR